MPSAAKDTEGGIGRGHLAPRQGDCVPLHPLLVPSAAVDTERGELGEDTSRSGKGTASPCTPCLSFRVRRQTSRNRPAMLDRVLPGLLQETHELPRLSMYRVASLTLHLLPGIGRPAKR